MPSYVFALLGFLILAAGWVPLLIRGLPLSFAVVALVAGYAFFSLTHAGPLSGEEIRWAQEMTRLALILAIMTAGLSIDQPFSFRRWRSIWMLLALTLPLTIAFVAVFAHWLLGLSLAAALLVGAILSPTDPVLASSLRVGPPGTGEADELRFALTAESGLNDGIAYPFVLLGVAAVTGQTTVSDIGWWAASDVIWKTAGGAMAGFAVGRAIVIGNRFIPEDLRIQNSGSGVISLGLTFLTYGLAEMIQTNGFVAVFATAVAIRNAVQKTDYLRQLHAFAGEVERVISAVVLAIFGGAIAAGVLGPLNWPEIAFAFAVLLVARPAAVMLCTWKSLLSLRERLAAGYLGVRGLASLYYVILAVASLGPEHRSDILSPVMLTVVVSAVLYGVTGDVVVNMLRRADNS